MIRLINSLFNIGQIKAMNYYFSGFVYDSQQLKLWFNGTRVKLTKKNNELLFYLLKNKQKLVNKDELITNIWNNRVVTGNTIDQTIMKLRKSLNDIKPGEYIESVYGQGLRFIPDVTDDSSQTNLNKSYKFFLPLLILLAIIISAWSIYLLMPKQKVFSKIDIDVSQNKSIGLNQNNWLIHASGGYLTYLLSRYNGLQVDGFSYDDSTEKSYDVLSLKITNHVGKKLNLWVDFKDSTDELFVVKLIDNNIIGQKNAIVFRSEKILNLFEQTSQWIISNYTLNSEVNDQIELVFTDNEYALESYFRGVEAEKTGNSNLAITYLKTATNHDPEFKYAWYDLAVGYRKQGDPKKALSILNAIKTNHPLLQYHITLVKAQCLDMTQDFVQAEIMYQNAYDAAINLKQVEKQSAVLVSQAIMNRKLKKHEVSETYLKKALVLTNIETQPYLFGTILNTYAKLERDQGHYDSAIEKSLLAIEAFSKSGDLRYVAQTKTALSSILILRNEFQSAKQLASDALFYAEEVNNTRGMSDNKTKLAMIYQKTGRFDLAIQNWNEVIELTEKLELYGNKAEAHFWLVKLYLHAENLSAGLIHLKQIEQIYNEEPRLAINNLWVEAQILMAFKQMDFSNAKILLAQLEKDSYWQSVLYLGDLALLQEKFDAAERHYLEYYKHHENSGSYTDLVDVLNRLSQLYILTKSEKLINNINKTASFNPYIYPNYVYKAQSALLMNNTIEAKGLIEEAKIKSKDLWQENDESILKQIFLH